MYIMHFVYKLLHGIFTLTGAAAQFSSFSLFSEWITELTMSEANNGKCTHSPICDNQLIRPLFTVAKKKKGTWTNAEKNLLIDWVLEHPCRSYTSKRTLTEDLEGLYIPGKPSKDIVLQAMYVFRRVRNIYKARNQTGQGSTAQEAQGVGTTYRYSDLEPLVCETVTVPLWDLTECHPGISRARTDAPRHEPVTPSLPSCGQTIPPSSGQVDLQLPSGGQGDLPLPSGQVDLDLSLPTGDQAIRPTTATTSTPLPPRGRPRQNIVTQITRREPHTTSLLQGLENLDDSHRSIFVAADATRKEQLAVDKERLKLSEAKLKLREKQMEVEQRRVEKQLEFEERIMDKKLALKQKMMEMKAGLEEKRMQVETALEEKRMKLMFELEEKKAQLPR